MAMNLTEMPLFAILKERMGWLSARQNVLAQNVANADTPGYMARDLKPVNFADVLKGATASDRFQPGLAVTDARHLAPKQASDGTDFEDTSTGATVTLEQEMIRVADT